jgi:DNA-directed RNA polymerase specialized sigma subunit
MNELQQMKEQHQAIQRKEREAIQARLKEIATLRFKENMSLDAIGKRYGITRQRVHQIINSI